MLQPTIQNMLWQEGYEAGFKVAKKHTLLSLLNELPKKKSHSYNGADPVSKRIYDCDVDAYNSALSEFTQIIKKNLEEL